MLTLQDIANARGRIDKYIQDTPILQSSLLNNWLGHEIFFKAECLQKIGAFKARGACNAISSLIENNQRPKRVIANSSGNHAQAVAWAASQFGIPATIFMPAYSSSVKIQATASYGAKIELCETRNIADEQVRKAAEENGTYWIPPFNNEAVIAGQGTAAYDALHQLDHIDAVFAPCGGGGLLSGTWLSSSHLSPKTKVIGAEPLNANDAAESLRKNSIQRLQKVPDTLADGAMTMAVGDITFEYLKKLDGMHEIEESRMIYWTQWLSHLLKVQVEPTSAISMEAASQWLSSQSGKKRILIILSGGNIDQSNFLKIWQHNRLDEIPS
ncbi:MAG: serine/threonine dehydratase [Reichenbachiella sp.]|uniref:serine/threonine dehydratase n=1 Tax=Reichenbachiella sp. TaxID=2184521 RepID=UPI003299BCE3